MTEGPVLQLSDSKQFVIQTDASCIGNGVLLTQNVNPVSFLAKNFVLNANSSTYVRELHATTTAIQKWRYYLLGK